MTKLTKRKDDSPKLQKLALLTFGLGPIIIMFIFLTSNGFFEKPI